MNEQELENLTTLATGARELLDEIKHVQNFLEGVSVCGFIEIDFINAEIAFRGTKQGGRCCTIAGKAFEGVIRDIKDGILDAIESRRISLEKQFKEITYP